MLPLHATFKANANTSYCHTTSDKMDTSSHDWKIKSGDSIVCSFSTTATTTANGVAYFRHKLHAVCQDTQYANNLGRRSADLMSSTYTYTEIETRLIRLKQ